MRAARRAAAEIRPGTLQQPNVPALRLRGWSIFKKKPAPDLIRIRGGNRFSVRKCDNAEKLHRSELLAKWNALSPNRSRIPIVIFGLFRTSDAHRAHR